MPWLGIVQFLSNARIWYHAKLVPDQTSPKSAQDFWSQFLVQVSVMYVMDLIKVWSSPETMHVICCA